MDIARVIILLWMLGSCTAVNAADLTADQHYANGLSLLSQNDGSTDTSVNHAGLLSAIEELEKALAMGIKPNKDVRLALSKAYYVCMTIADSTKERPMNDKEKNAVECRKKGSVLIKHLNEEFPDDPRVLEQFAKSSIFDKELQITIYEKLVKIGSKDANVHGELASLYLGKGKNNEGIAQYREAIMLGVDPRIVAHYLENLDTIFDEFGCPLEGLKELTRKIAFTDTPSFDAQPQVKEKFNVEFAQLKKQVIKKIDSNRCKKLSNK